MSDEPDNATNNAPGAGPADTGEHPLSVLLFSWMRSELFDRVFLAVLGGFCALLAALELVIRRHDGPAVDGLPVFYGVYGFLAFSIAVLSGWPLARLLRRPENYYSDDDVEDEEEPDREESGREDDGDDR